MPAADVKIVRDGDPPPWADLNPEDIVHVVDKMKVAVLENGMASGKPSIAIRIDLEDSAVVAETSLEVFASFIVMARAAFPEVFEGGPLQA